MYHIYLIFLTFFSRVFSQNVSKLLKTGIYLTPHKLLQITNFKANPTFIEKFIFIKYTHLLYKLL